MNHDAKASGGIRTHDRLITNQLLCQLSYAGGLSVPTWSKSVASFNVNPILKPGRSSGSHLLRSFGLTKLTFSLRRAKFSDPAIWGKTEIGLGTLKQQDSDDYFLFRQPEGPITPHLDANDNELGSVPGELRTP